MNNPAPASSQPPAPKSKHGCAFYGCLTLVILAIIGAVLITATFVAARKFTRNMVTQYTQTNAVELPRVASTPTEQKAVADRCSDFMDSLQAGKAVQPLVLSARDLNLLVARSELQKFIYLTIEDSQIKGQVSLPLENLGQLQMMKGRYLNGAAQFKVGMEKSALSVSVVSMEAGGKPVPAAFLSGLSGRNLAEELLKNPDIGPTLRNLENVEVKDGKLILTPRAPQPAN
jgi:hypothetical protein